MFHPLVRDLFVLSALLALCSGAPSDSGAHVPQQSGAVRKRTTAPKKGQYSLSVGPHGDLAQQIPSKTESFQDPALEILEEVAKAESLQEVASEEPEVEEDKIQKVKETERTLAKEVAELGAQEPARVSGMSIDPGRAPNLVPAAPKATDPVTIQASMVTVCPLDPTQVADADGNCMCAAGQICYEDYVTEDADKLIEHMHDPTLAQQVRNATARDANARHGGCVAHDHPQHDGEATTAANALVSLSKYSADCSHCRCRLEAVLAGPLLVEESTTIAPTKDSAVAASSLFLTYALTILS